MKDPRFFTKKTRVSSQLHEGLQAERQTHVWTGTFFFREMTVRMFRVDAGILARFYTENVKIRKNLGMWGIPLFQEILGKVL